MAKTSIKPAEVVTEESATTNEMAITSQASIDIAHYNPDQYDDTSRDIEVPVLGLINNVGPLAQQFRNKSGSFALGDILIGESVDVIPVTLVKLFRETYRNGKEIKYGSPEDKTRKVFASAQDAVKSGYMVDFDNNAMNRVEECGKIGWLIIAPAEDKSGEFILNAGGIKVAQGRCSYQRGGYRNVFRKVFDFANRIALAKGVRTKGLNHTQVFLAAQPWTNRWTLTSTEVQGGQNSWFEPRIARCESLPQETIDWITQNYGTNGS
jgi:hypothetical protein